MTKQQAISLRLAQWLGNKGAMIEHGEVYINDFTGRPFNPFSDSERGRAQFAECVIKADQEGIMCMSYLSEARQRGQNLVEARLEAIYYAIGAVREWVE